MRQIFLADMDLFVLWNDKKIKTWTWASFKITRLHIRVELWRRRFFSIVELERVNFSRALSLFVWGSIVNRACQFSIRSLASSGLFYELCIAISCQVFKISRGLSSKVRPGYLQLVVYLCKPIFWARSYESEPKLAPALDQEDRDLKLRCLERIAIFVSSGFSSSRSGRAMTSNFAKKQKFQTTLSKKASDVYLVLDIKSWWK